MLIPSKWKFAPGFFQPKCPCCGQITHRNLSGTNSTLSSSTEGDYGAVITPTGVGLLHDIENEATSLDYFWITGTRESSVTAKRILATTMAPVSGDTIDFGADTYSVLTRIYNNDPDYQMMFGGDANGDGYTLRSYDVSGLANLWNSSELSTRVNGMINQTFASGSIVVGGLDSGGDTLAAIRADDPAGGTTLWAEDPTSGDGEASDLAVVDFGGVGNIACYKGQSSADNLHYFSNIGGSYGHIDSKDVLSGANLNSVAALASPAIMIAGGESDGSNTVEAYDYTSAMSIDSLSWSYNTGSTVHKIRVVDGGILVVGDRNASGKSAWVLNSSGTLVTDFDHGDDLRAIRYSGTNKAMVAGDRV